VKKASLFLLFVGAILCLPTFVWATTVTLTPTDDAYVSGASPGSNYGSSSNLLVGDAYSNLPPIITRSYLKFDLSGIPSGAPIVSAKLYIGSTGSGPNPPLVVGSHYLADDSWSEGGITYSNAPTSWTSISTDNAVVENKEHNLQCCDCWDVLDAVEDDVDDILSIVLKAHSYFEGSQHSWCQLASKEDGSGQGYEPRLEITYTEEGEGSWVSPGIDCYITENAMIMFGPPDNPPLPADFFGPGSDPFDGIIALKGKPLPGGVVDTLIQRVNGADLPSGGASAMVDVEMVALSLTSIAPIRVTYYGGMVESFFDVFVTIPEPSSGQMSIVRTHENGGTFNIDSFFDITYQIEFTEPGTGQPVATYITPNLNLSGSSNTWQDTPVKDPEIPPCSDNDFYPNGEYPMTLGGPASMHKLKSPQSVQKYFLLACHEDWQEARDSGEVRPMTEDEWNNSMSAWETGEVEGEPYNYGEPTMFRPAELYVYDDGPDGGGGGGRCEDDGLVMVWMTEAGQPTVGQNYASAWVYEYAEDPDLTNCIISVDVYPPASITTVSYRMVDINGLSREWWWNVPADIPDSVLTTVTIDTSVTGTGATNPPAAGYVGAIGFDITQVVSMAADENGVWFPDVVSPPPGGSVGALWNYWYNLSVTPKPFSDDVNSKWFVKYSQPPVVLESGLIDGWDEKSSYQNKPIMADDWLCEDDRPITDFHWWGSYLGWTGTSPPPIVPKAFHIGIWTDVPKNVDGIPYSRPGTLVWENFCDSYIWNFAGYDRDPRIGDDTTGWMENEACFQFAQFLSENEWFKQEPEEPWPWEVEDEYPNGRVYWLSIAAIYDPGVDPVYPWGWKTREHIFNDDAVRINSVMDAAGGTSIWPPTIGSMVVAADAEPVEYPDGTSWDLAFELTTNVPGYADDPIPGDLNYDGTVDLEDFSILAGNFLSVYVGPYGP
jgi:hypothetical protein